jgi:hypothetical protein
VRGIYEGYAGWFDGDAATMYAVSPAEAERRADRLAGGAEAVRPARRRAGRRQRALALRLTSGRPCRRAASRAALTARKAALAAP